MNRPDPIGKTLKFHFGNGVQIVGKCLYVPVATGDCWYVEDQQGGVWGVQQFERVFIYPEPPK